MSELKQATQKAVAWSLLDRTGQQVIYFCVVIVTARIIAPAEFGVVASLAIFTALANMLLESGLSIALIRKIDSTDRDYNTVFYTNSAIGIGLYTVLYFCAPLIARFNDYDYLTVISRVLFLNIIFNSLGIIQSTLLIKKMDFRSLAAANIASVVASGVVAVVMAVRGYGVWALVAQQLVMGGSKTLMLWMLCRWTPKLKFYMKELREMYAFSYKLMIGNIINTISNNFYTFVLRRYFPFSEVGFYSQAAKMKDMGAVTIWNAFGSSTHTMLAKLQNEPERLKNAVRKTVRTVAFVAFPAMSGLAVVAGPLVDVTVTSIWAESVPYMQLLCVGSIFFILSNVNGNFIKIAGRSGEIIRLEAINAVLLIVFMFLTIGFGLRVAVISDVISKMVVYGFYMAANSRGMGYRIRDQIKDIAPSAAISAVMCLGVYLLKYVIHHNLLLLAVQVITGGIIYIGVNKLLGSVLLDEILQTLKRK